MSTLILATLASLIVLYAPGYLCGRALSLSRFASVAAAPLFSVLIVAAAGVALDAAGITCPALALLGIALAVGAAAFLVACGANRTQGQSWLPGAASLPHPPKEAWRNAALYLAIGIAVTAFVFLANIDGASSFARNDDTAVHLSVIRGFLDSGTYSTLHVSSYLDHGATGSFYPAGWYITVAIVAALFGNAVTLAVNASCVAICAVVFPLGMCLLLMGLFPGRRRVVLAGAVLALAFSAFPWAFLVKGQLLPNMMAFALVPGTFALLVGAFSAQTRTERLSLAFAMALGVCAIAVSQPNGVFTFGIWGVLYVLSRLLRKDTSPLPSRRARLLCALGVVAVACVTWAAFYLAPFMQNVVQYSLEASISTPEAILSGLSFMFTRRSGIHPFLSVVVLIGVIRTFRHREDLWLTIAFAFALVGYILDAATDGVAKHVLTGFWYTDVYRTAAMTSMYAVPLAALGFTALAEWLRSALERLRERHPSKAMERNQTGPAAIASVSILLTLFLVCQCAPFHVKLTDKIDIYMGWVRIQHEISDRYSWDNIYTADEHEFVQKALSAIPEGSLVINLPHDGSAWAYGVDGADTYFRRPTTTGLGGSDESKLLRLQLCNIATSDEVRQAVDTIGARYVLVLDDLSSQDATLASVRYKEGDWVGISSITESTPGFKLILEDGDKKFFEIL